MTPEEKQAPRSPWMTSPNAYRRDPRKAGGAVYPKPEAGSDGMGVRTLCILEAMKACIQRGTAFESIPELAVSTVDATLKRAELPTE